VPPSSCPQQSLSLRHLETFGGFGAGPLPSSELLAQARATRGEAFLERTGAYPRLLQYVRQRLSTALLRAEMTSLRRLAISYDSGLRGDADGYAAARARRDDAVGLAELRVFTPCGSCCLILCICTCSQTSYH